MLGLFLIRLGVTEKLRRLKMNTSSIDIVLPWVNGQDKEWQQSFRQHAGRSSIGDTSSIRFRDWDLLRYWFRGVEKFMPWINKIHFVTSGHIPDWLNLEHPQLNWVKHEEFIPQEYLPTFSANTIELNLHRIESLSEHFIYFNDDLYVLNPVKPSRFFKKGLPCDYGVMTSKPSDGSIIHMAINDLDIIDSFFNKHQQIRKFWRKWFSLNYGFSLLSNAFLFTWRDFSGFVDPHLPNAFLKSTYHEVWSQATSVLHLTCRSRFRSNSDVNQWLIRYWQLAAGNFYPYNTVKDTTYVDITDSSLLHICDQISRQEYDIMCLNDSVEILDFKRAKNTLKRSFKEVFPSKSAFEKY